MELSDYLAAIRRHWRAWVGLTLLALAIAAGVLQLMPKTYEATARVFVAVSPSIPNSAQFVDQRVKTYPDVATSGPVLAAVIDRLGLQDSLRDLRRQVTAEVPLDTSQVQVTVADRDPQRATEIANAIAARLTTVVEDLETPPSGNQPVTLTVSDPAIVPTTPVSPQPVYAFGLALLVGLLLGLATAVVRSRMDTVVHGIDDVRRAWGVEPGLEVLAARRGHSRRVLTGRPAATLARRLEFTAADHKVRIVLVSPSPDEGATVRRVAEDVTAELEARNVAVTVSGAEDSVRAFADDEPGVWITLAGPLAPAHFWKLVAERYDGAVVVVPTGKVEAAELREVRIVLRTAGVETLAVVVTARPRRRRRRSSDRASTARAAVEVGTAGPTAADRTPATVR